MTLDQVRRLLESNEMIFTNSKITKAEKRRSGIFQSTVPDENHEYYLKKKTSTPHSPWGQKRLSETLGNSPKAEHAQNKALANYL